MIILKKLTLSDKEQLMSLIAEVENALPIKDFWLPINETSRLHFFDKDWTIFLGAFLNHELIGASALFLNPHEFGESLLKLEEDVSLNNLNICNVVEIGRSMVKPYYQGNNLLFKLNSCLLEIAKSLDKKYVIATIHPDNLPSQSSFKKLGMQKVKTYEKKCGYVRDVFFLQLL